MPLFTIGIPTRNRDVLLRKAMESVLSQAYKNYELLIVDDASTNNKTRNLAHSFKNAKIRYLRNRKNIGPIPNFNRCLEESRGKYVMILCDDDRLYPNFLEETEKIYKKYPSLGFTYSHCNKIDANETYLKPWGWGHEYLPPSGYMKGSDYLFLCVKNGSCPTSSSTAMINKRVLRTTGTFTTSLAANTFDFNLWIRIADKFDTYYNDKILANCMVHPKQATEIHWRRSERPTGKIGMYLELIDSITRLLKHHKKYQSPQKRLFLLNRLSEFELKLTHLLKRVMPEL